MEEALKTTENDILYALDGLMQDKIHGSPLKANAFKTTISNYIKKLNSTEGNK
jgi:nitrogen fixation NifU-like protein